MLTLIKKILLLPSAYIVWFAVDEIWPGYACPTYGYANTQCASHIATFFGLFAFLITFIYMILGLIFIIKTCRNIYIKPSSKSIV